MSQSGGVFDFGKFFPGLDFFTGKGASAWLMPTVSEQELDKRIAELKTVLFWLEQNAAAIKAGIQALEVQKMTLATLQSMNVGAAELARAFAMPAAAPKPAAAAASAPPPPAAIPEHGRCHGGDGRHSRQRHDGAHGPACRQGG